MTSNQLTEQQIDLLIENGYDIAHTLENLAENEINSDCFEVFSYSENGRETEWDGKITEFAQRAAKAIRHLTDATTALQAELQERRKADSEPVAEITEDLGRLFVKIHYPTTLRVGDKLYLHAQTSTAGEPVLWAWQNLDMWHVTSHHGRARDLGLSGFKVIPLYRHAQPAPVVPDGLNPETTDLVLRFASALADKLYKAEQKYGRSTDWMKDDWYDDCLQSLLEHIEKGDPKDVAAYCAFMWHHGWETKVAQPSQEEQKSVSDRQAIFALESAGAVTPIGRAYKMKLNACRAAMLAATPQSPGSEPATVPGKWIPVSEQMPEIGDIVLTSMGGVVNVGETECSAANCRFFTSVISGRELPATHWMPLPAGPQEGK
ncbi:DUF551 domain-containing protein [Klebsiella quasipneumoniae]|nr:DUF551 domain-containing protein [Klebsiella quasipneumoniae]